MVDEKFMVYPHNHDWQGGEPLKAGHAISVRHRTVDSLGPLPNDLETYRNYQNPSINVSEHWWSFMKDPWR